MNILDKIAATKHKEVDRNKVDNPVSSLEKSEYFSVRPRSLKKSLEKEGSVTIIAEFKRKSPSRGVINENSEPTEVSKGYVNAGAAAISVLTDTEYFGGSMNDLSLTRQSVSCPLLRKDFIVDEYQIIEARAFGADAILLIAEMHSVASLERLYWFAYSLGMEVLVEIHDKGNISKIPYDAEIIGINSRNLSSFNVDTEHPSQIVSLLPDNVVKVAESGVKSPRGAQKLIEAGFNALLIGEYFMNSPDPAVACNIFISDLMNLRW